MSRPKGSKNRPKSDAPDKIDPKEAAKAKIADAAADKAEAAESEPEPKSAPVGEAPPPRVRAAPGEGKPKKKRAKVKVPPPPKEVSDFLSEAPLQIIGFSLALATGPTPSDPKKKPIILAYSPEAIDAVHVAFAAWLADHEWELTPGWALLAAYAGALGSAAGPVIADALAENEKKAAEEAKRAHPSPPPGPPAPRPPPPVPSATEPIAPAPKAPGVAAPMPASPATPVMAVAFKPPA